MERLSCILMQLILIITLFNDVEPTAKDYTVTVTAYSENGLFLSGQLVPLQCIISPVPPFPIAYIWRSSTQNHYPDASFPSSVPITTVFISENHPLYGRYYCHVLSAGNRTTLAVGHVTINPTGILQPDGTTDKPFIPPAPLQIEAKLQPEDSRLLNILSNITYEWQHNYTVTNDQAVSNRPQESGFVITDNRLTIARTIPQDAGIYTVKIDSFGVLNATIDTCANAVFQVLGNYATFKEVEFYTFNSNISTSMDIRVLAFASPPKSLITKEVTFVNGEPLTIDTRIPIARIHRNLITNPNTTLNLRVFYNGELLHPREVLTKVTPMPQERAIVVTLTLPRPIPDDEGVYEMQLFVDISRLSPSACLDYVDFVRTSDGLNVPNVLVGSTTLHVHQQGPLSVTVEATKQILTTADGTETLPILSCLVMEDKRLPVMQLRWIKSGKVLAEVQDSRTLAFDLVTNPVSLSPFGVYTCEAITSQNKAENSVLIAERANFTMELVPVDDIRCLDLSKETMQLMLDMLLMELQFSFSYETDADFTTENFSRSSLVCSSEGNSILMSTDVIYSNSDGSITASALVEMAEEWMNGMRTANGATFQITRPGTTQSFMLNTKQVIAIGLSMFSFGVIIIGIIILATCCIAIKQRRCSRKYKLDQMHQHNPLAHKRESTMNNSAGTMNHTFQRSEGSTQVQLTTMSHYDRLVEDARSVPLLLDTVGGPPDVIQPAFSKDNRLNYGSPSTVYSRGTHLPNIQGTNEEDEVVYTSLSVTENYAYNKWQDLPGLGHPGSKNEPNQTTRNKDHMFFNQRQRSVHHYDYPKVNEDICEGDTDSLGYQSINNMTKD